jgi:O-succinylbenzoate synthase
MRLWVHRYELVPRRRLSGVAREGSRQGALLRVGHGFADVHPWPELGDLPLDEQLTRLARGETTPLTRASLRLAALDGDARRRGVSLFEGLRIPLSHWPGAQPREGFDTVKVKSAEVIPDGVRLRFDFNATLTAEEFVRIAETLPKERVDFVEDPCTFDEDVWAMLSARTGLTLAYDRPGGAEPSSSVRVLVHKPAVHADWPDHPDVVVTSYMDHPVGQFGAAFVAASHRTNARCGLFTHVLYESDAFIDAIESEGARLLPPRGTGLGFDALLDALQWTSIG